jgi:DNA repair exonuclease SbcCD ATPase subunit
VKFGPTILHNIGPFEHVEYDLSKPGLTGVEGVILDHPGCASNGSGKSFLLDGPSWICFDRPLRDRYGKDDLIRLQFRPKGSGGIELVTDTKGRPARPQGGSYGVQHIIGGAVPIRIERYRGHPTEGNKARLIIDGEDVTRGRDSMTNAAIEEILGMDYRAFVNSIAFGAREDVKSFFSATDTERKAILDKLLGMEVYAAAQVQARNRLRDVSEELAVGEQKRATLRSRIEEQELALADLMDVDEDDTEFRWKRSRMLHRLSSIQQERIEGSVEVAKEAVDAEEEAAQDARDAYREAQDAYRAERRGLESKRRAKAEDRGSRKADARQAQDAITRWEKLSGKCPTCEQMVPKALKQRSVRAAIQQRDEANDESSALQTEEMSLGADLRALQEPVAPDLPDLAAAEAELQEWKSDLRAWLSVVEGRAKAVSEALREHERAQGRRETVQDRLTGLRETLEASALEDADMQLTADRLEFWVEGFGPGGLRSFLIENEIPEINRVATRYAQRLLGAGAQVRLTATRLLKSGGAREELGVEAVIPGCTITYAGASKGQRKRLDLAILLAFREIVGRRFTKSFDQLFADELFDGLDGAGEESVVELLREISADCPVTLVTHSDVLKAATDRLLVVSHAGGVATLEEL